MRRDFGFYLHDILAAGEAILEFTQRVDFAQFQAGDMVQAAVERKLAIIGEAMVQARHHFPDEAVSLGTIHGAIALRNVLGHEYDRIVPEEIWRIIENDVPDLLTRVQALIAEYERAHE